MASLVPRSARDVMLLSWRSAGGRKLLKSQLIMLRLDRRLICCSASPIAPAGLLPTHVPAQFSSLSPVTAPSWAGGRHAAPDSVQADTLSC